MLEKYWVLDSFGADLVWESGITTRLGEVYCVTGWCGVLLEIRGWEENSGGNANFEAVFLYLIRREENVSVGWVAIG